MYVLCVLCTVLTHNHVTVNSILHMYSSVHALAVLISSIIVCNSCHSTGWADTPGKWAVDNLCMTFVMDESSSLSLSVCLLSSLSPSLSPSLPPSLLPSPLCFSPFLSPILSLTPSPSLPLSLCVSLSLSLSLFLSHPLSSSLQESNQLCLSSTVSCRAN